MDKVEPKEVQPIFSALANPLTNAINLQSLEAFYSNFDVPTDNLYSALDTFAAEGGVGSELEGGLGLAAFSQAISQVGRKVDSSMQREIEQECIRMIETNPAEVVRLLGLPREVSGEELLALLRG
mmetsp:Transcript_15007/g.33110  ORF Transcript_15007/g.33110 Transcript_15007/m.33110 type:complete len:125 (-) Transcript_15007:67-441(-)